MSNSTANPAVIHPMAKFQRQVESLVNKSKLIQPSDPIWKIALLFGDDWAFWRQELEAFDFKVQDPIQELLAVVEWEDE